MKRKSPHMKLLLAIYMNTVIAGILCFYAKRHVAYWHGAALQRYFGLRPVNLLMYESLKDACSGAYTWFDFNPSGGHKGVETFKKRFGCYSRQSNIYVRESIAKKIGRFIADLREGRT
jgi:lipid II:glycine glycyltransferase (peptidoglycan interpeptide bridge formation enzyme)